MAIQKQFVLRYREEGHIRFQIPVQFCESVTAKALTEALLKLDGIYRVNLYPSQKKLSIRYQETVCDFKTLCVLLFQIIADLEKRVLHENKVIAVTKLSSIKAKVKNLSISKWFSQRYDDARETLQAAKILTNVGLKNKKALVPEKALIDFFNDMLALFLIKLHWEHITKYWIPNPIKYRYEWLAVSYMVFLLMRSRHPK
ncbi:MAG: hypothetical protein Q8N96_06085 [Methylovulum sp.]|nr:hypothetical protein [Methylovulum sp.]